MNFDVPPIIISKLFNSGFEDEIIDIILLFETDKTREVSDIPISPDLIPDSNTTIIIKENIYKKYIQLIQRISSTLTAEEIPFLMVGNKQIINGIECIVYEDILYEINSSIKETSAKVNEGLFKELILSKKYSVISIGHTHGNLSEAKKANVLANLLPEDIREKYKIRESGLNISIADIWQHYAYQEIASQLDSEVQVNQTIIMFNGDIVHLEPKKIIKSSSIKVQINGDIISLQESIEQNESLKL